MQAGTHTWQAVSAWWLTQTHTACFATCCVPACGGLHTRRQTKGVWWCAFVVVSGGPPTTNWASWLPR